LNKQPQKILVIRLSSIGDILLASPLLRLLKKRFPGAELSFLVKKKFADAIRINKHVDRVISLDTTAGLPELMRLRSFLKRQNFDLVLDIHRNFRSLFLRSGIGVDVFSYPKFRRKRFLLIHFKWNLYDEVIPVYRRYLYSVGKLGIEDDGLGLEFWVDEAASARIKNMFASAGFSKERFTLCLAPGAGFATKRWLPEYFLQVANRFVREREAQILLLGDERDRKITGTITAQLSGRFLDLSGELSLMESAAALTFADLFITNDTGLMHLSVALAVKTIAVFGPTTRELGFFPTAPHAMVVENAGLSCRPCTHVGSRKCPKKHFRCMREVLPEQVYEAASRLLV
jgi:lipopolysaccharide heptosyltransferase II